MKAVDLTPGSRANNQKPEDCGCSKKMEEEKWLKRES